MSNNAQSIQRALQLQQTGDHAASERALCDILATHPGDSEARFRLGLLREAQGRIPDAVHCFDETLRIDPQHLESHLHRAKLFHLAGRTREAADGYLKVLSLDPDHATARVSLANIAYRAGQFTEAEQHLREALQRHPRFAFAHHSLARVLKAQQQLNEAEHSFRRAVELDAGFVANYTELGALYVEMGQPGAAEAAYRQAMNLAPETSDILNPLGLLLLNAAKFQEAIPLLRRATELDPRSAEAHNNLGLALAAVGDHQAALCSFQSAVALRPDSPDILANLARSYLDLRRLDEAERACRQALAIDPAHVAARTQHGLALMRRAEASRAFGDFQSAVQHAPTNAETHNNLGTALFALNQHDAAIESFSRAIEINPQHIEAHYNRGLARLRRTNCRQGWDDYEWRKQRAGTFTPDWDIPQWDGSPLAGKSMLIYGEQGIGDELMFACCFNEVIEQASSCLLVCERRLVPLFARSFPRAAVIAANDRTAIAQHIAESKIDLWAAAGSLPQFLRSLHGNPNDRAAYLSPDPHRLQIWRQRYAELPTDVTIGISWRGGADAETRTRRSAGLSEWTALLELPGVSFVNLQYGDTRDELDSFAQHSGIQIIDYDDSDPLQNLDDFAAQIAALDLVISVDNSTVHMAGALGVPTWVALPTSADWRWGIEGETTHWYPALRLFRRNDDETWRKLFHRLAAKFRQM